MTRTDISRLDDLRSFARDIATDIAREGRIRLIVLLDGPMGAGKTQFTKFFLEAVGSLDAVSPSFAVHNSYETSLGVVHHFDLFRLESADDLESTGFWDLFSDEPALVVIEWAQKLSDFGLLEMLPAHWDQIQLKFEVDLNGIRSIETSD